MDVTWLLLQGGDDVNPDKLNCYTGSGGKLACVLNDLTAAAGGEANFGLFLGAVVVLVFYLATGGRIDVPAVLTILFAGILIPMLPGGMVAIAGTIMLVGMGAGVLAVLKEYVLDPSV